MSEHTNAPESCVLPEVELRARRAELDRTLATKIVEVRELADGYALRFDPAPTLVEDLGRFIEIERACCAFLTFTLRVAKDAGPIELELTGSAQAKTFLQPTVEHWLSKLESSRTRT
jgi:hypothetical protein